MATPAAWSGFHKNAARACTRYVELSFLGELRTVKRMKLLAYLGFWMGLALVASADSAVVDFEATVAEATQTDQVTIVHFWASWCGNCKAENENDGWKTFVQANPDVKVIFISVWGSAEDDHRLLESYGLAGLSNFQALRHPNQNRRRGERMTTFLGLPVTWIPSTWIYRGGQLRFALNYGEVRFDVLSQLVADSTDRWSGR